MTGLLTAFVLAAVTALAGCTAHIADSLPASVGGLPERVPARSESPAEFPAVHDRPPARADAPLNEAERKKLKDDLIATRDRAARLAPKAEAPAKKKVAEPAAKKKKSEPPAAGSVSAAGTAPNP